MPPLDQTPDIDQMMRAAGFSEGQQPGIWVLAGEQVDLLVPEALASPAGRRAARLPGHGRPTARKVCGSEGAVVDNEMRTVRALEFHHDLRSIRIRVAGPGALLISKAFERAEHVEERGQDRLADKDAFDAYRRGSTDRRSWPEASGRCSTTNAHARPARSASSTSGKLFASTEATGSRMAGRSVENVGEPETVRLATAALAEELPTEYVAT